MLADSARALALTAVAVLVVAAPADAAAEGREGSAAVLVRQMSQRGAPQGEVHLALAALHARAGRQREVFFHLDEARKQGVPAGRTDLLLGAFYRTLGRFDAAMSTLVRVLVRHSEQPYALVQLWKTLYECKLQGTEVKTDLDSVRERLATSGLHFPSEFKLGSDGTSRARKLTAAGYNALLGDNAQLAAELFQGAIDALPSHAQAHRGLGIARARLQDFTRAAGAYLLYLELAPLAPDADEVDRILMDYWKNRCKGC